MVGDKLSPTGFSASSSEGGAGAVFRSVSIAYVFRTIGAFRDCSVTFYT